MGRRLQFLERTANFKLVAEMWRLARDASRTKCMESGCRKPPEMECIWADGRGRAWFCEPHFKSWSKNDTDEGLPKDIVKQRKVPRGEVGEKYGEYPKKATLAERWFARQGAKEEVFSAGHVTESDVLEFAAIKAAKATGVKTGDGHGVGLFIPLPKNLAKKFPSLGDDDDSPSHITFLYIGEFFDSEKQEDLITTLRRILRKWWPDCTATLDGLEYFDHHDKDRRVPHIHVEFDRDMAGLRHRVKQELQEAGIEVADHWPEYKPHVTLAYMPGMDAEWEGSVPKGKWTFDTIEVWGLPKVHKIKLGPSAMDRVAQEWLRRRVTDARVGAA